MEGIASCHSGERLTIRHRVREAQPGLFPRFLSFIFDKCKNNCQGLSATRGYAIVPSQRQQHGRQFKAITHNPRALSTSCRTPRKRLSFSLCQMHRSPQAGEQRLVHSASAALLCPIQRQKTGNSRRLPCVAG